MAKPKNAEEMLTKAKVGLVLEAPFITSILVKLPLISAEEMVETMATDGEHIYYAPSFVMEQTLPKLKGVLAHEVFHVVFKHPYRRGDRDHDGWNEAGDHVINLVELANGYDLPDGGFHDPQYQGMETEKVYTSVMKNRPKQPTQPGGTGKGGQGKQQGKIKDPGKCGAVMDAPAATKAEMKAKEEEATIMIKEALEAAKKAGKLPAGLERQIESVLEPVVDWVEKLAQFVDTYAKNDFSMSMPNRRYVAQGLYLPSLRSNELGHVTVLIDASGSVSNKELRVLVSEAMGIIEAYTGVVLYVIFFDSEADQPIEIDSEYDIKSLKVKKGGGTDYRPPFEMVDKAGLEPVCVVVLTDGDCHDFPKMSAAPVLWVLNRKNKYFRPPFGDTVYMPEN